MRSRLALVVFVPLLMATGCTASRSLARLDQGGFVAPVALRGNDNATVSDEPVAVNIPVASVEADAESSPKERSKGLIPDWLRPGREDAEAIALPATPVEATDEEAELSFDK